MSTSFISTGSGIRTGRILLSIVAAVTSVGTYIADWNETHIYNSTWPPHAKFHNAQTMSMGAALGLTTLYYVWRPVPDPRTAQLVASLYWVTMLSA